MVVTIASALAADLPALEHARQTRPAMQSVSLMNAAFYRGLQPTLAQYGKNMVRQA